MSHVVQNGDMKSTKSGKETLILAILATVCTATASAQTVDEKGCFSIDNRGSITGFNCNDSDIAIPEKINGIKVRSIGKEVFKNKLLTSVKLPANLKSIGADAFNANRLTSIKIPINVREIGDNAFSHNQLVDVDLPNGLTIIGGAAFADNKIVKVKLPGRLKIVSYQAFADNQLNEVVIPNGVKLIEANAFMQNEISRISLPNTVTDIENGAFLNNKLEGVNIPDSVTVLGGGAFNNNLLVRVKISKNLTEISDLVFDQNRLTSVELPPNIKTIGYNAFSRNVLKSIEIPGKVEKIGVGAFVLNQITSINLPASVKFYSQAFDKEVKVNSPVKNWIDSLGIIHNSDGSLAQLYLNEAFTACPSGTHLPTPREFATYAVTQGADGIVETPSTSSMQDMTNFKKIRSKTEDGKEDNFLYSWHGYALKEPLQDNVMSNNFWTNSSSFTIEPSTDSPIQAWRDGRFYFDGQHGDLSAYAPINAKMLVRCFQD